MSRIFKSERRESVTDLEYGSPAARSVYRVAIHLTLIVGALIFSMPFLWMVSCSLKEDDEQMREKLVWFPRLPPYQAQSPYIDAREGVALLQPDEVSSARWARIEPAMREVLDEALKPVTLDMGATPAAEAHDLVRAALWADVAGKIPSDRLKDNDSLRNEIARAWENAARPFVSSEALKDAAALRAGIAGVSETAAAGVPRDPLLDPAATLAALKTAWPDLVRAIPADRFGDESTLMTELRSRAAELSRNVPETAFKPEDERVRMLRECVAKLAGEEQTRQSHRRTYRALAVGDISLRAEGEAEQRISCRAGNKPDGALIWKAGAVSAGASGELRQRMFGGNPEEEFRYAFTEKGARATAEAIVPFQGDKPPKAISVGHKSDASWNRVWFAIELNGKRYESVEPYLLAGLGRLYGEAFFQLPSPDDDDDLRIRHWTITKAVQPSPQSLSPGGRGQGEGAAHNQPGSVKIEWTVENTSAWTKVYDKFSYNYHNSLRYIPFWRYFATSVFLVVMNVVLAIFSSSLIAFAFARLNWPGRELCWAVLLGTIMIPGQVTMIPNFLIMKWLGWYNTLRPMWVCSAFGSVFFIFMLRQFMKNIPKDLEDAAKIDGCSYWQIYWNVVLPLVKPTLAAIGIFTFMGVWNDFMGPLMYVSDQRYYPLSLGLFAFQTIAGGNQGMMMAASLMMTLPVIALFFVAQKQFIQGVTFTGIKG